MQGGARLRKAPRIPGERDSLMDQSVQHSPRIPSSFSDYYRELRDALDHLPELELMLLGRAPEEPLSSDQFEEARILHRRLARAAADMRSALATVRLDGVTDVLDDPAIAELREIVEHCEPVIAGLAEQLASQRFRFVQLPLIAEARRTSPADRSGPLPQSNSPQA